MAGSLAVFLCHREGTRAEDVGLLLPGFPGCSGFPQRDLMQRVKVAAALASGLCSLLAFAKEK